MRARFKAITVDELAAKVATSAARHRIAADKQDTANESLAVATKQLAESQRMKALATWVARPLRTKRR